MHPALEDTEEKQKNGRHGAEHPARRRAAAGRCVTSGRIHVDSFCKNFLTNVLLLKKISYSRQLRRHLRTS